MYEAFETERHLPENDSSHKNWMIAIHNMITLYIGICMYSKMNIYIGKWWYNDIYHHIQLIYIYNYIYI